ncbi:ketosteroid isomerase family protein [Lentilactobacillus kisonensis]|uniref:ketosteroid isomerase family protein n=1 Tax=Lentilactobacillus kisonensis TaxID=481722 RepID=UPI0006D19618|nr:ketosteroid isomerase family protein [Lentilactobacillus kisonensis]
MSEKEQTINQYFQLSDQASKSQAALHSIIELFADDAEIFSATGETCAGTKAITNFFHRLFQSQCEAQTSLSCFYGGQSLQG